MWNGIERVPFLDCGAAVACVAEGRHAAPPFEANCGVRAHGMARATWKLEMCAHQLRGVVIAAVGVANEAFLFSAPISASPSNDGSETTSKLALRSLLRFPISFHACLCVFWLLPVMDGHFRWRASASPPHLSRDDGDSDDPDDTAAPCRKGPLPAPPLPRAPSSTVTPAAASGPVRRAAVQRELERMARLRAVLDAREAEVLAVLDSAFTWLRCSAQPCVPDAAQAADECAGSWYGGQRQAGLATVVLADDDDDGSAVGASDDYAAPPAAALFARRSFTSPIGDGRRNGARPANGGGQLHSAVRPVAQYSLAGGDENSFPAQASQAAAVIAGCAPSAGTHTVGGGVVVRAEERGEGGEVVVKRKRGRPKGSGKKGSLAALTPSHAPPLIRIPASARLPSPASTPRAPATPSASPADAEKAGVGSGEMEAAAWGERREVGRDKVKDGPAVVQFKDSEAAAELRGAGRAGDGSSGQRGEGETEAWRMSACGARRAIEPAGGGGPGRPAGLHGGPQRTGGDEGRGSKGPSGGGAGMGASGRGRKSKGPTGRPRGRPRVVGVEKKGCADGPRQWQERAQEGQAGKRVGGEGEKAESSMAEDDSVWPVGDGGGRAEEGAGGRAEGGPVYLSDPEQRRGRMLAGDLAGVAGGVTGASSAPPTPSAALGACVATGTGTGTGTGVDDAAEALEAVWGDASGSHGAAAMGSSDGLVLDDMQACTLWLHGLDALADAHCMLRGAVAVAGKRVEERGQDGGGRVAKKMRGSHVGEGSGDGGKEGVMGRGVWGSCSEVASRADWRPSSALALVGVGAGALSGSHPPA
ncbi:unnamed protein product [Closterium sp. Naga37s-1]|nr:unnamed protein product [Closterium sp. Naga37s-1]